ncbi:hypothetical protein BDY24DRAFT_414779 [Mrakia frigida]|uniref:uncharacterized protein n=1 Tax=Mrakia frigida TaxID=29902 RepID=UPI003FCC1436
MAPAPLSPAEASFFPSLFTKFQENGTITGQSAFNLLPLSDVPLPTLGEIWGLADPEDKGALDVAGWTVAMRLISVAQKGGEISREAGEQASTALPKFRGHPPPPPSILRTPQPQSSFSNNNNNQAPALNLPLTPEDIAKFKRHFQLAGPVNGRLPSDKATSIFFKSKLPSNQLGAIWNLADTQDRGALDQADFIIGMYFIQGVMSQKITTLPQTLPPGLYETASEGRSLPVSSFNQDLRSLSHSPAPISAPSTPIPRQVTGQQQPMSPVSRNVTGGGGFPQSQPSHQMLPNVTGGSFSNQNQNQNNSSSFASPTTRQQSGFASAFTPAPAPQAQVPWDVTAAEKTASDKFFDELDTFGRGILDGDVAVPFMLQSKLPEVDLASIWDLADIRKEGNLTRDEFAVAMYLIRSKISGKGLPESLPASLVPPSLRQASAAAPAAAAQDLFDAFGDSPPASASAAQSYFGAPAAPTASAPTSPPTSSFANSSSGFGMTPFGVPSTLEEDLFGDETPFTPSAPAPAPPTVQARSPAPSTARSPPPPPPPELTKLRTENSTLSRSVSDLQSSGLTLENQTLETAKEIMDLQAKLVGLRATHESEKGNVDKLKLKAEEQAAKLKEISGELIRAESELSGLRGEKTELDGQLMRDKEDIREMKRRMVEVAEETTQLKAQVEKVKRDARQQKGLLAITKKQVGTAETEKEKSVVALGEAERGVGIEEEGSPSVASPFAAFAPSGTSAFSAQVASQYPLPETPERMLSPALSVASQKSNNPFDRFVAPPPPASPAAPIKELASPASSIKTPTSPVTHVKELALGGVAAAGTVLAGVGAAIFGSSEKKKEDDEPKKDEEEEKKVEEPTPAQAFAASAFDDSFGASPPSTQTPFAPASSDNDATKAFDAGFGDSFDDGFETTDTSFPTVETTGPPLDSPSAVPFTSNGFDSTFGDEFTPVKTEEETVVEKEDPAEEVAAPSIVSTITPEAETIAPPAEPVASTTPTSPAPTSPAAPTAPIVEDADDVEEIDSSDDEDEGPEDLDGMNKSFASENKAKSVEPEEPAPGSQFPDLDEPTSEPSSNLTSTASAFGTDDSVPPPTTSHPFDDAFEPTPPSTIITPPVETPSRRAAPPPPPHRASANVPPPIPAHSDAFGASPFETSPFDPTPTEQESPFESSPFGNEDAPASNASPFGPTPPVVTAPPSDAFDVPKTSSTIPAVASFDDDFDRDFDDVPAAQDIPGGSTQKAAPSSAISPIEAGFDDFDDFSTDFDPIPSGPNFTSSTSSIPPPPPSNSNTTPAYDVDPSFADFDSAFGETPTASTEARPAAPSAGFSFDDAFGDEPAATPAAPPTNIYAPPPGPPPTQQQEAPSTPTRPALPQRKTAAEPDDM